MSWFCKVCETVNEDTDDVCVVCNSISPVVDNIACGSYFEGEPALVSWINHNVDELKLIHSGKVIDLRTASSVELVISHNTPLVFIAQNQAAERQYTFNAPPPRNQAKFCIICGNEYRKGDKFCIHCGSRRFL